MVFGCVRYLDNHCTLKIGTIKRNLCDSPFSPVPELIDGRAEILEEGSDHLLACLLPLVKVLVLLTLKILIFN